MSSLREDLISISNLSDEMFSDIAKLATESGYSSMDWALYLEKLEDDLVAPSQALFRLFNYIGSAFADARDFEKEKAELDEFISTLSEHNEQASKGWEKLRESYKYLDELFLRKKEEIVKSRFSNVTESSITVDARPVYSMDRSSIKKVLYPFILKLETNDDKTFLCELYSEQLELLEEEIRNAKNKVLLLEKRFCQED